MIKGRDIICISSIDWDFVWQGHQEIMSTFADNGNRVLFIENTGVRSPRLGDMARLKKRLLSWFVSVKGFNKKTENLYTYSPVILPFPYSKIARMINKHIMLRSIKLWMKAVGFHNPIIWTFLPTGTALDIIDNIDHDILVYYCIADFYELVDKPEKLKRTEDAIIKKCDIIFAQGDVLKERCQALNDNVHIFPFGVKMEIFEDFLKGDKSAVPEDMKLIKSPVIGYVGGIHKHIDFELLKYTAQSHPEWSIVLVGPQQTNLSEINKLPNVFLLGKKDFLELPAYINRFDVCIIPYEINGYTKTVFPTKLNEYHAMGKAVVSTDLPEVAAYNEANGNLVALCKSKEGFIKAIEKMLLGKDDPDLIKARIASAGANSWKARILKMSRLMKEELTKERPEESDWKNKFLGFYKVSRKGLISTAVIIFALYLLLLHTPLLWILARPLVCSNGIEKSDAIVVFAGGVGESGKAGQGYEERVSYAADLYKKGYSGNIIFSSGYVYEFKEPFVMKALAISLGIPEEAISLETKAASTYENVKFSDDIILAHGWRKIILITSPYNMKRAALVFRKIAPDIKVVCAPVPYSRYYGDGKKVTIKHLLSIAHEYIGLVLYKIKGLV